jgi:hypothetical protein
MRNHIDDDLEPPDDVPANDLEPSPEDLLADDELSEDLDEELVGEDLDEELVGEDLDEELVGEDLDEELVAGALDDELSDDALADDEADDLEEGGVLRIEDDEEDEEEDDDVEASLDVILKERLVVPDDEEDEDEDAPELDERGDAVLRVLPKQPDEFVCQSCFLVKNRAQLADPERLLCRDCV